MKTPNLIEVLREYLADGGSEDVYTEALIELSTLKECAKQMSVPDAATCSCWLSPSAIPHCGHCGKPLKSQRR